MTVSNGLAGLPATQLADMLQTRQVGACEVLDDHLAAVERLNPPLNAIITLAVDQARARAKQCDNGPPQGLLHGLPLVIKDVTETEGIRTTYASPIYRNYVPKRDAEVVRRLRAAGAIVLGKTNTPEFAAGANTVNELFGATRNPWNSRMSPAGSSGGSAVAVASGMVPLAQGTDFGCSIRIPASFCGIVGVRTTPGLIPNESMRLPWDAGQVHGPLARSAEDAALMLDAMVGLDPYWPLSAAPPWRSALDLVRATESAQGLRMAYVRDISGLGIDDEVEAICRDAATSLRELGAFIEERELDASGGFGAYKTLRSEWMVGQQYERLDEIDRFGANLAGNVRDGLALGVRDTAAAEQVREQTWSKFRDLLHEVDYILTPCAPVPPYPVEKNYPDTVGGKKLANYIDWIAQCFLVTFVGFPAASAPAGKTRSGLPVGLQIVGRRFDEPGLLGIAKLLQILRPIGHPPIFGAND